MILVAHEESSSQLIEPLRKKGLPVEKTVMPFGDIAFEGRGEKGKPLSVGIEFKTITELVASMRSGRLDGHQLVGMRNTYDERWLLIEGEWSVSTDGRMLTRGRGGWQPIRGQMTASEFNKHLQTLKRRGGLDTWHTSRRLETIQWIADLYRWWTDVDEDEHKSHLVIYHPPPLHPVSDFRFTLSTLPGISYRLSAEVEKHFGTDIAIALASPETAWAEVPGIGPITAKKIVRYIRGR